jgi:hypothetical protein
MVDSTDRGLRVFPSKGGQVMGVTSVRQAAKKATPVINIIINLIQSPAINVSDYKA